jgi:hypothetical protein
VQDSLLKSKIDVAERHARILERVLDALQASLPIRPEDLAKEDELLLMRLDQFQSRFSKLQDHIGSRIFPAVLDALGEDASSMSVLDRLYRLEALGFVENAESWADLRAVRNQLAHDYPESAEALTSELGHALQSARTLLATWRFLLAKVGQHPILSKAAS